MLFPMTSVKAGKSLETVWPTKYGCHRTVKRHVESVTVATIPPEVGFQHTVSSTFCRKDQIHYSFC